jgi:hypothetical protein
VKWSEVKRESFAEKNRKYPEMAEIPPIRGKAGRKRGNVGQYDTDSK